MKRWGLLITSLILFFKVVQSSDSVYTGPTDPIPDIRYEKIIEAEQVIAEGWLLNGERDQYWKFYKDEKIIYEGHYNSGKKVGYWKFYDDEGFLLKAGHFINDKASAWWVDYNKKGSKIIESEYVADKKHGLSIYYKNGRPYKAEKYDTGILVNTWTELSSFIKDNS